VLFILDTGDRCRKAHIFELTVSLEANGLLVPGCDQVILVEGENQVIIPNQRRKVDPNIGGIFFLVKPTSFQYILLYIFSQTQESGTILLHATLFLQPNTLILSNVS
jgi:hypothetical protein